MSLMKEDRIEEQRRADITNRLQTYVKSLQFFDDHLDDYIYIYDLAEERVYFTQRILDKLALPLAEDNGVDFEAWNRIIYHKDRPFVDHYRKMLVDGEINSFNIVYRVQNKYGRQIWVNVTGRIREDDVEESLLLVGRISEVTRGRVIDVLTGLRSVEKFEENLIKYQRESAGYLMVLGVDDFKNINITHGRTCGDEVLQKIAAILDQNADYPISLYRLHGDGFAAVFPEMEEAATVNFFEQVQKDLEGICTLSAGVVSYEKTEKPDSGILYQYAEAALDMAKREGKNRLVFFSSARYRDNLKQIELLDEMRECIRDDCRGFFLCYQPQINSRNYEIYGVEALLRFESATRGVISPAQFIPLLEKSGLIWIVGKWVMKTAMQQCKQWRKTLPNLHLSVNLSYVQLAKKEITGTVLDLLKETELPGEALTLEVTESIQLQEYDYFNKIFYAWKKHGIRISIDDFGTGYSSLGYLKSIDADEVKIDRCFVARVQYNAYNYRLLSNMIELAHSANISVCCEGVETQEELLAVQELHTDLLQGYLFAKPCSVEEIERAYLRHDTKEYTDKIKKRANLRKMDVESDSVSRELLADLRQEEIVNLVERMDEMIYVSDADTYELYYLNAAGRRITGTYDYRGRKCYEVLQGKERPCEFCAGQKLCSEKFYLWEKENRFLGRYCLKKDKLISWQGKTARFVIALDMTVKEVVAQSLSEKI